MKQSAYRQLYFYGCITSIFLTCYNGTIVTNTPYDATQPDINFYGTLQDHSHTTNVEYILIAGRYNAIPVYNKIAPQQNNLAQSYKDIDPKQNRTLINLQDIKSITLAHPENPGENIIIINNKQYIEIIIESLHGNKQNYIVETTRKITCKQIDKNADFINQDIILQNREVHFIHIKKLTIQGYKKNINYQQSNVDQSSLLPEEPKAASRQKTNKQEKNEFKNNTAQLLQAIEINVKNLPLDNPSAFEAMRSTILTLLKSLRDQLQKFLDMIK